LIHPNGPCAEFARGLFGNIDDKVSPIGRILQRGNTANWGKAKQEDRVETQSATSDAPSYRWVVWSLLVATYMVSFFHRMAISVVKEPLMEQFSLSLSDFGMLASMYFYAYCLAQIPCGIMVDSIGVRRTAAISVTLAGVATIAFGCTTSPTALYISRFAVGLGVASSFVCVMKAQSQWFREREFSTLAGVCLFVGNLGSICAQAPLGMFVAVCSMRTAFLAIGCGTLVLALLCLLFVRNKPEDIGLSTAVSSGTDTPSIPLRRSLISILKNRHLLAIDIFYFFVGSQLLGFAGAWSISFLRDSYGIHLAVASKLASVQLLAFMLGSLVLGYASDHYGKRKIFITAPFLVVCLVWFFLAFGGADASLAAGVTLLGVAGFFSGAFSVMMTLCKEVSPRELTGTSIAMLNTFGFLGIAISTPLYGKLVEIYSVETSNHHAALLLLAGMNLAGCVCSFFFRESGGENLQ